MLTISQAQFNSLANEHFKARLFDLLRRNSPELVNARSAAELGPLFERAIAFARAHGACSERELAACVVLSLVTAEAALSLNPVKEYLVAAGDTYPDRFGRLLGRVARRANPDLRRP
jgi:hypothetical protein